MMRSKTYRETLHFIHNEIQETFLSRSPLSGLQCPFCQTSQRSCLEEASPQDPEQECLCKAMLIHLKRHCLWLGTLIEYQIQEIEEKKRDLKKVLGDEEPVRAGFFMLKK